MTTGAASRQERECLVGGLAVDHAPGGGQRQPVGEGELVADAETHDVGGPVVLLVVHRGEGVRGVPDQRASN